jgi:hypothetical protein
MFFQKSPRLAPYKRHEIGIISRREICYSGHWMGIILR